MIKESTYLICRFSILIVVQQRETDDFLLCWCIVRRYDVQEEQSDCTLGRQQLIPLDPFATISTMA
jgi:hypothetical protein